jgi:hypothetical protein
MKLKNLLTQILNEDSFTPGKKIHFKKGMSDDEVLDLANKLGNYPHSKLNGAPEQQNHFRDLGLMLGMPLNPTDLMVYTKGKGYLDKKKMKMKPNQAPLFQMYKDKKLDMKAYGEIQKKVLSRYLSVAKLFVNGLTWRRVR